MRRQMSHAVRARPMVPVRRRRRKLAIGWTLPLRTLVALPLIAAPLVAMPVICVALGGLVVVSLWGLGTVMAGTAIPGLRPAVVLQRRAGRGVRLRGAFRVLLGPLRMFCLRRLRWRRWR